MFGNCLPMVIIKVAKTIGTQNDLITKIFKTVHQLFYVLIIWKPCGRSLTYGHLLKLSLWPSPESLRLLSLLPCMVQKNLDSVNGPHFTLSIPIPLKRQPKSSNSWVEVTEEKTLDDYGMKLLDATGGLPLAITLLAHQAQAEGETTEDLWYCWQNLGPSFFSRDDGDGDRQLSVVASIHLSLSSPWVQAEPTAPQVLAFWPFFQMAFPLCQTDWTNFSHISNSRRHCTS